MDSLVSLTRSQKRRFKRLIQRSDNGRVVRRAQVLLQLASGVSPTARVTQFVGRAFNGLSMGHAIPDRG